MYHWHGSFNDQRSNTDGAEHVRVTLKRTNKSYGFDQPMVSKHKLTRIVHGQAGRGSDRCRDV
jgi:hypothetical protein